MPVALSLLPIYLLGLGSFMLWLFPKQSFQINCKFFAIVLSGGICINYFLLMAIPSLTVSFLVGSIFAALGLTIYFYKRSQFTSFGNFSPYVAGILVFLLLSYPPYILFRPLVDHDARSIWFMHGKMIHHLGGLYDHRDWHNPAHQFSHLDYPKLIPSLAAQIAWLGGVWNDFVPKISIFVLYVSCILAFLAYFKNSFRRFLYLLLSLLAVKKWICNGYMDGYVAWATGASVLALIHYMKDQKYDDLILFISMASIALGLKNEGALAILMAEIFFIIYLKAKWREVLTSFKHYSVASILPLLILPLGFVAWLIKKNEWHLNNDLDIGTRSFGRILMRLKGDGPALFFNSILNDEKTMLITFVVILVLLGLMFLRGIKITWQMLTPFLVAMAYGIGLFCVYMATTWDLQLQLDTSIERTVLILKVLLNLSIVSILCSSNLFDLRKKIKEAL